MCDCAQKGLKPCRVNPNFEKCFDEEGCHIGWRDPMGDVWNIKESVVVVSITVCLSVTRGNVA